MDLGCGPGLLAARLTAAGFPVLASDPSPACLAEARRRAPRARLLRAGWDEMPLPPGSAAVCAVGEVLNYLPAAGSATRRRAFLERVREALRPGGVLLLDLAGPRRAGDGRPRLFTGRDWSLRVASREEGGVLERRIRVELRSPAGLRIREHRHRLALLPPEAFLAELRAAGFACPGPEASGPAGLWSFVAWAGD